jgi:hypothetical protein
MLVPRAPYVSERFSRWRIFVAIRPRLAVRYDLEFRAVLFAVHSPVIIQHTSRTQASSSWRVFDCSRPQPERPGRRGVAAICPQAGLGDERGIRNLYPPRLAPFVKESDDRSCVLRCDCVHDHVAVCERKRLIAVEGDCLDHPQDLVQDQSVRGQQVHVLTDTRRLPRSRNGQPASLKRSDLCSKRERKTAASAGSAKQ